MTQPRTQLEGDADRAVHGTGDGPHGLISGLHHDLENGSIALSRWAAVLDGLKALDELISTAAEAHRHGVGDETFRCAIAILRAETGRKRAELAPVIT